MKFPTLYKRASNGNLQVWWMESDLDRYRTLHGIDGGEVIVSEWTYAKAKNVGRSNETTPEEQAKVEIASQYKKKLAQGKYSDDYLGVDTAKESYISPMLAEKFDPERIDEHFYIQPKFNGVRCIATKYGLWSRKGKEFVNCPHITDQLKEFFDKNPDAILDGELYNHDYKADFNSLVSAIKKQKPTPATQALAASVVRYYVYDLPSSGANFSERFEQLEEYFTMYLSEQPAFELSPTFRSRDIKTAQGLHERNKANGYEGSIVRLDKPYEFKRTYSLMKYKDFQDDEFEIADIVEGTGNWSGVAKVVWIVLPGRPIRPGDFYLDRDTGAIEKATQKSWLGPNIVRVSKASVKGSKEYCKRLLENKEELIGKLGTVVFFELTPDNVPLFPIFQVVRDYE